LSEIPANWPNKNLSEYVVVQGIRWHVQIHRHINPLAKIILLIHGAGSSAHSWEHVLPNLANDFTVIAPDIPGHGFTVNYQPHSLTIEQIASDLKALLEQLYIGVPDILIGHSAGCNICLSLAILYKEQPSMLIGFNPALVKPPEAYKIFLGPLLHPIATSTTIAQILAHTLGISGAIDKIIDSTNSALTSSQRSRYTTLFSDLKHINSALTFVTAIDTPKLLSQNTLVKSHLFFVVTHQDTWIPPLAANAVIRYYYPQAVIDEQEGGHLFHEVYPNKAIEIIRYNINKVFFHLKDSF
jgi:magnesium chelatase accessory protein